MDKVPNIFDIGFTKSFELAFNTVLKLDEMQGRAFEALDGKVIELWIAPSKTPLFCLINNRQIACQQYLDGDADATLKTGMRQLVNLTQGEPLEYRLIQGDESLAKDFAHAMQSVEIDWEEHLSHLTGDLVAFKVGHSIRSFLDYKKQTKQSRTAAPTFFKVLICELSSKLDTNLTQNLLSQNRSQQFGRQGNCHTALQSSPFLLQASLSSLIWAALSVGSHASHPALRERITAPSSCHQNLSPSLSACGLSASISRYS